MKERIKILVVEDQLENLKAAKKFFNHIGKLSVDYVTNLEEAKKKLMNEDYFLGIFDLDIPVKEGERVAEKAGLELGTIAREKKNMFYVYYSGGFFHGTPRTTVYLSEKAVLRGQPDFDTFSKESPRGWKELFNRLLQFSKEGQTRENRKRLKDSIIRYIKFTGKIPKVHREVVPSLIDIILKINNKKT